MPNSRPILEEIDRNRARGAELSKETRAVIISRSQQGASQRLLARELCVPRSTIEDTLRRWKQHGTLKSLPRSGRPKTLSAREKRMLCRTCRKSPNVEQTVTMEQEAKGENLKNPKNTKNPKNPPKVLFTDQKGKPVAHNPGTLDIVDDS